QDGKVKPFIRSEPIPETNDEPVKVVVANSLKDMTLYDLAFMSLSTLCLLFGPVVYSSTRDLCTMVWTLQEACSNLGPNNTV
ncbi:hypothetical protein Tco_0936203, partial [Tanacetum coccineum]